MRLNINKVHGQLKCMGGSLSALVYDRAVAEPVVAATRDPSGGLTPVGAVIQLAAGWGPFVVAAMYPGPFTSAFAGAITYRRIEEAAATLRQL